MVEKKVAIMVHLKKRDSSAEKKAANFAKVDQCCRLQTDFSSIIKESKRPYQVAGSLTKKSAPNNLVKINIKNSF